MDTKGYGGRLLSKTITVYTNDPAQPDHQLKISGDVEKVVEISPNLVRLFGAVGESVSAQVRIVPAEKHPFDIVGITAEKGKEFEFGWKKDEGDIPAFLVTAHNLRREPGRYFDTLEVKTTSTVQPVIQIRVFGNIYPAPASPKKSTANEQD